MIPQRHPKTPHSAVVLIPPEEIWEPIQAIRRERDPHVHRWMPHITLLFPFFPEGRFAEAAGKIEGACARVPPFHVWLARFDYFPGPKTAWLDPEPAEPVISLQAELQRWFPYCDDVSRHAGGFRPHLSVGQGPPNLAQKLQADWKPLEFEVNEVALIHRDGPDDPFQVHLKFPLGE